LVISGKGGTGKTSVIASCAILAGNATVADCDVDAADLHLVLAPRTVQAHTFVSGHEAVIRKSDCDGSGVCQKVCRFGAVVAAPDRPGFVVDPLACEGCGVCVELCPSRAIDFKERECGKWFSSTTRSGPMIHARLGIGAENSGKLVSTVRAEARKVAARDRSDIILIDGPPGIGCPVIAALTGVTGTLIVTEPSVSGAHDMERVLELAAHFGVSAAVCVNRWDLNPEGAESIEAHARDHGARVAGRIRYDAAVTRAQVEGRTVVELGGAAADDIRVLWDRVWEWLEGGS
jgi:MinD superfamily P-loop ATPase